MGARRRATTIGLASFAGVRGMVLMALFGLALLLASTLAAGVIACLSEPNRKLRLSHAGLVAAGCVAAVWCTFFLEYQPNPTLRIVGFPLPVAVFRLQNGQWFDFVGGPGWLIDLIVVPSLVAMPLSLVLLVRAIRRRNAERRRGFPVASHPR